MALEKVDSEWLAFLDVDDFWEKDKLEKQVEIINQDDGSLGLIYGRCNFLYEGDHRSHSYRFYKLVDPRLRYTTLCQTQRSLIT